MRIFVTGATGWIGSATVDELVAASHDVVGMARSDDGERTLEAKGATVLRGDLDDLDALRRGAADAEAVIHLANKHDWANPAESNRAERAAVQTIADALVGTDRPFLLASGISGTNDGRAFIESDPSPHYGPDSLRGGSENLALEYVGRGVRAVPVRFAPTVHGVGDNGFVAILARVARERGVAGYIGDGNGVWPAVHRSDAARLVRLGLEQAPAGTRLHAVGEDGVPTRAIADALGQALDLPVASIAPVQALDHFGFLGHFFGLDAPSSSALTQQAVGWEPTGPTLLEDIAAGAYSG